MTRPLIAHGIVNRATEDIDLFADDRVGVRQAVEAVTTSLPEAGLDVGSVGEMDEVMHKTVHTSTHVDD